jgi:hypothetical protein
LDVEEFIEKHRITEGALEIRPEMVKDAKHLDIRLTDRDYLMLRQRGGRFELLAVCGCGATPAGPMVVVHLAKMRSFSDMKVRDVPVEIQVLAHRGSVDITRYKDCRLDLLPSAVEFVRKVG